MRARLIASRRGGLVPRRGFRARGGQVVGAGFRGLGGDDPDSSGGAARHGLHRPACGVPATRRSSDEHSVCGSRRHGNGPVLRRQGLDRSPDAVRGEAAHHDVAGPLHPPRLRRATAASCRSASRPQTRRWRSPATSSSSRPTTKGTRRPAESTSGPRRRGQPAARAVRVSREAPDVDRQQVPDPDVLRPAGGVLVLRRVLGRRSQGDPGGSALSRRLRRDRRRGARDDHHVRDGELRLGRPAHAGREQPADLRHDRPSTPCTTRRSQRATRPTARPTTSSATRACATGTRLRSSARPRSRRTA